MPNGNETKQMLAEISRRLLMPAINFITSSYPKSSFWRHSKLSVQSFLLWEVSWIVQNPQCQTVLLGISTNHIKTTSWPLSSDLTSFFGHVHFPFVSLHLSLKLLLISIIPFLWPFYSCSFCHHSSSLPFYSTLIHVISLHYVFHFIPILGHISYLSFYFSTLAATRGLMANDLKTKTSEEKEVQVEESLDQMKSDLLFDQMQELMLQMQNI